MTLLTFSRKDWPPWRIAGVVFALVGLIDSVYLSYLHFSGTLGVLCETGGGCDIVQSSVYAKIAGVPIAALGLIGYVLIMVVLLAEKRFADWGPTALLGLTAIGTLYSVYLTYIEIFVLQAICPYCVISAVAMLGLMVVAIARYQQAEESLAEES